MKFRNRESGKEVEAHKYMGDDDMEGVCRCGNSPAHVHTGNRGRIEPLIPGVWLFPDGKDGAFMPIDDQTVNAHYEPAGKGL